MTSKLWGVRVVVAWVKLYTGRMPTPLAGERRTSCWPTAQPSPVPERVRPSFVGFA
ncbi:MAG: hypothetical protein LC808_00615 [Actinobacteria bacterium]|nr:hypothetical protein [Actinomycetota bacterium]